MDDKDILGNIDELIKTEHELRQKLAAGELSGNEQQAQRAVGDKGANDGQNAGRPTHAPGTARNPSHSLTSSGPSRRQASSVSLYGS